MKVVLAHLITTVLIVSTASADKDFVVVKASRGNAGRRDFIPTVDAADPNRPRFKLLTKQDLARENRKHDDDSVIISIGDDNPTLPTLEEASDTDLFDMVIIEDDSDDEMFDTTDVHHDPKPPLQVTVEMDDVVVIDSDEEDHEEGSNQTGPRRPLPEFDDIVLIEAPEFGEEGRGLLTDIPRDFPGPHKAGPRLPLPETDDIVLIEESEGGEEGRRLSSDIPRDFSGPHKAGPRLPLPETDDAILIEAPENDEEGRGLLTDIPRDFSGPHKAGPRLPLPETDDIVLIEESEGGEEGRRLSSDIPRDFSGPNQAGPRLPRPGSNDDEFEQFEIVLVDDDSEPRNLGQKNRFFGSSTGPDDDDEGFEQFELVLVGADEEGRTNIVSTSELENNDEVPNDEPEDDFVIIGFGDDELDRRPKSLSEFEVGIDCFVEPDPGPCSGSERSWFYDETSNKCHIFRYSGCGGNTNRFSSETACLLKCKDAQKQQEICGTSAPTCQDGCRLVRPYEGACLECVCRQNDICLQPPRTGLCKAFLPYWYFDIEHQTCREFTYGGCAAGSSSNKFQTEKLCLDACLPGQFR